MKIYVKNMVCGRCRTAVKNELEKAAMTYKSLELGEIELDGNVSEDSLKRFKEGIETLGFELIEDKPAREVNQIKKIIIEWVREQEKKNRRLKFSAYLSELVHKDYASLSNLFSGIEGTTIEQYLINQKIELVKELLVYNEYTLAQIADQLNYSSVQHLSSQFKKITGLTPSHFKKIGALKRRPIDEV
ncbi:MAG TPA: AraC family transcriptional regulator [Cyclobacteriaceae bacterium]|nr:AraC family transcriptional regulator [Cyclobacteriaceae bacterium]